MRRFPWDFVLALLFGLGLGLAYSWLISPLHVTDAGPAALRTDFKDQFRSAIAASYSATNNLLRAQARLALLGESDQAEALNSQAQRMIASGEFKQADQLAALAMALKEGGPLTTLPTSTKDGLLVVEPASSPIVPPTQDFSVEFTETPEFIDVPTADTQTVETQVVISNPTLRPTRTPIPTLGTPFALIAQDTVCDTNLPEGLLQVIIFNSNRRQIAGAKIIINWENGEDQFFTGLKPEIGNGYADFVMTPNITYTLRLAIGSDIAAGLITPTCQTPNGETFLGGIKLTFQQP